MDEMFMWQALALFWALVCFFRVGAMVNGLDMSRTRWLEIAQISAIGVLLFGLLTDGRGIRHYAPESFSQNLLTIQPVQYQFNNVQSGANFAAANPGNSGLGNAAITGNLTVHPLVSG